MFCPIVEVTPTHDKKQRAQAINGRMAKRMVYFPSFAPWWGEARDQLLKFPFGSHDDFVDMLAWLGLGLGLQHVPHVKNPKTRGRKSVLLAGSRPKGEKPHKQRRMVNDGGSSPNTPPFPLPPGFAAAAPAFHNPAPPGVLTWPRPLWTAKTRPRPGSVAQDPDGSDFRATSPNPTKSAGNWSRTGPRRSKKPKPSGEKPSRR